VQVNYDFHQELTPERLDQILDAYQQRAGAGERA
jgi:NADH:ubiquinone oxidoreductase subunit E